MSCAKQVLLPVEPDDAWAAVTEPEALEAWLAERVELELRPGGAASFLLPDGERRDGVVEEVTPGRRLAFWWWPAPEREGEAPADPGTRVTFELVPAVGGTEVRVTETPAGPTACASWAGLRSLAFALA